ncbi:phosphatidylglycerophosphatase A-like protein [Thiovulum sp. ES]|nr:phosphatidylglycerophosphatase A-like protein [Thiovulum sp. ES]
MDLKLFFLTVGYSGLSPKAPGTVGTVASLPIGVAFLFFLPPSSLLLLTILISIFAVKIIDIYEKEKNIHDPKEIVIDELVGLWLAFSISLSDKITIEDLTNFSQPLIAIVLSFFLFRLFDIWKPSIIGKVDQKVKGGLGVVGDDLLAGLVAGLLASAISHNFDTIISLIKG